MYRICIQGHFDAAHHLRDYKGNCARVHGHTWNVRVDVEGEKLNKLGMIVDFVDIKRGLGACLDELDHRDLNNVPPFTCLNPTAENLAEYIYGWMEEILDEYENEREVRLVKVRVYESPNCYAEYYEEEPNDKT